MKSTGEKIKLAESESGHLIVNVGKTVENNKEEVVSEILFMKKNKHYEMQKLRKIHRVSPLS